MLDAKVNVAHHIAKWIFIGMFNIVNFAINWSIVDCHCQSAACVVTQCMLDIHGTVYMQTNIAQ